MKAHEFLNGKCKHGYSNYCPHCEEERRTGLIDFRLCPKCGYGLQRLVERGHGVEIYECQKCHRKIPTQIEITIGDKREFGMENEI